MKKSKESIEEWRDISGYEGLYQVSNLGRVRSLKRFDSCGRMVKEKILKPQQIGGGYFQVSLSKDGQKFYYIHRLVAKAFIPNPNNLPQINHKDEDTSNNCVDNLEWCSSSYNCNYGHHIERMIHTNNERGTCKAEHPVIATEIHTGKEQWFKSQNEAARQLSLNVGVICRCVKGRVHKTGGYTFRSAS